MINWINKAIDVCENFKEETKKFELMYKQYKTNHSNIQKVLEYLSINIDQDGNPIDYTKKLMTMDAIIRNEVEYRYVYLVKIKNTIDGKQYLLVGYTNCLDSESIFKSDPLVEFREELKFVRLKKWQARRLTTSLIKSYKPSVSFDPYARFDGDENVIEMRFWKEASKSIDYVEKNIESIDLWLGEIGIKNHFKDLQISYSEYALDESFWYQYKIDTLPRYYDLADLEADLTKMNYSDVGYLRTLNKIYSMFLDIYNDAEESLKNHLDEINNDFEKWKSVEVSIMKKYVYYEQIVQKLKGDNYISQNSTKTSNFYFFGSQNPLGVHFKNTKDINPIGYPWHAKNILMDREESVSER